MPQIIRENNQYILKPQGCQAQSVHIDIKLWQHYQIHPEEYRSRIENMYDDLPYIPELHKTELLSWLQQNERPQEQLVEDTPSINPPVEGILNN